MMDDEIRDDEHDEIVLPADGPDLGLDEDEDDPFAAPVEGEEDLDAHGIHEVEELPAEEEI